jgi:acyl-CoA thioester hydrolase
MSSGFVFSHRLPVRFRDCDPHGHVNNAVFHTYLEETRLALWRHVFGPEGMPGAGTILARVEMDYRAPAFVNDLLEVGVTLGELGRSSIPLVYNVINVSTRQSLVAARTVIVTFDYAARKPMPIPAGARERLLGLAPGV